MNNKSAVKEFTMKEKVFAYLKGLVIATGINCSVAGVFFVIGHFAFHAKLNLASYSNSMFIVAVLYMLYCFRVFRGDLESRVDSSNLEMTSTKFDRNGGVQAIRDKFTRGKSIMIAASYLLVTLGISYLLAVI